MWPPSSYPLEIIAEGPDGQQVSILFFHHQNWPLSVIAAPSLVQPTTSVNLLPKMSSGGGQLLPYIHLFTDNEAQGQSAKLLDARFLLLFLFA